MFTISNTRKIGDLSFITAKGRPVNLRPARTLQFADDDLNDGLLRSMIGKGSFYKVLADSAEAQEMIDKAGERKAKKNGSPLVHGTTDPPDFNEGRDKPIKIRDLKEKPEHSDDDKPPAPQAPTALDVSKEVFIQEELKEKSPLEKLIEAGGDKPYGELVAEAKAVLGEKFPDGRPGRPAILKALTEFKATQEKPQE